MRYTLSLLFCLFVLAGCDQSGVESATASAGTACAAPTLSSVFNQTYPGIGPHATMGIQPAGAETDFAGEVRVLQTSGQYGAWGSLTDTGTDLYDGGHQVANTRPAPLTAQYRVRAVCDGTASAWSNVRTVGVAPAY